MMKLFNILCVMLISASATSYAGRNRSQSSNNLRFQTHNLQQFNSKRNGKLEMAGLLSQLAGNTLNQIGQATGNKELQIAGFATNQMGVNASAINSFRQKDGSFSAKSKKQKQKNNPNNPNQKQNPFKDFINTPASVQPNPWQKQNPIPPMQNVDLLGLNPPAQNVNPPAQMQKPGVNSAIIPPSSPSTRDLSQKADTKSKTTDLLDLN